ncbi:MAG: hypothetical protein LC803_10890 [Acidobacteria bacterium]|nr:hypothetical protein [Acidobacteriota bacterium]
MAMILGLKSAVEARAVEQAARRGVPVKEFLESLIEDSLSGGEGETSYHTMEEWEAALDEFADSPAFAKAANRFVDDSRERIY